MTGNPDTCRAQSSTKFLLLLVTVVLAPVLFIWLTSMPSGGEGVTARLPTELMLRNRSMGQLVYALLLNLKP